MIVNGVFKGGGAKGVAYAGALQACEEAGVRFRAVAGSSAGAIAAALVACGYSARELADLLPTAMRCLNGLPAAALRFSRRCLFANGRLEAWLDEAIARRVGTLDHRPTFADVRNATGVELYVVRDGPELAAARRLLPDDVAADGRVDSGGRIVRDPRGIPALAHVQR